MWWIGWPQVTLLALFGCFSAAQTTLKSPNQRKDHASIKTIKSGSSAAIDSLASVVSKLPPQDASHGGSTTISDPNTYEINLASIKLTTPCPETMIDTVVLIEFVGNDALISEAELAVLEQHIKATYEKLTDEICQGSNASFTILNVTIETSDTLAAIPIDDTTDTSTTDESTYDKNLHFNNHGRTLRVITRRRHVTYRFRIVAKCVGFGCPNDNRIFLFGPTDYRRRSIQTSSQRDLAGGGTNSDCGECQAPTDDDFRRACTVHLQDLRLNRSIANIEECLEVSELEEVDCDPLNEFEAFVVLSFRGEPEFATDEQLQLLGQAFVDSYNAVNSLNDEICDTLFRVLINATAEIDFPLGRRLEEDEDDLMSEQDMKRHLQRRRRGRRFNARFNVRGRCRGCGRRNPDLFDEGARRLGLLERLKYDPVRMLAGGGGGNSDDEPDPCYCPVSAEEFRAPSRIEVFLAFNDTVSNLQDLGILDPFFVEEVDGEPIQVVEVGCSVEVAEFDVDIEIDFIGDPDLITPAGIMDLEQQIVASYNTLTLMYCDPLVRSFISATLIDTIVLEELPEEGVRGLATSTIDNEDGRRRTQRRQRRTRYRRRFRGRGRCRGCGGRAQMFDEGARRALYELSRFPFERSLQEPGSCFCDPAIAADPAALRAPSFDEFLVVYAENVDGLISVESVVGGDEPGPTASPSEFPEGVPTPSVPPTPAPTRRPTPRPVLSSTEAPSSKPSVSLGPSHAPSNAPSSAPSLIPSEAPSSAPTDMPSDSPTSQPSAAPSGSSSPTAAPSESPSESPVPTPSPSAIPSSVPSREPSLAPTKTPSGEPSAIPSSRPSLSPTKAPSITPSAMPSDSPTSQPSAAPSGSTLPTVTPSESPSGSPVPSPSPSDMPSSGPSLRPSLEPSEAPSDQPSDTPSSMPSLEPSNSPSARPSESLAPSVAPSEKPSGSPVPSPSPSKAPSLSASPSSTPSEQPSLSLIPSTQPSEGPSLSASPSSTPSDQPSVSLIPSTQPSEGPSLSASPSSAPSDKPSVSLIPSTQPSEGPSLSASPSSAPSDQPSVSLIPSTQPSEGPSLSAFPSSAPSDLPSVSLIPSSQPSQMPSVSLMPSRTCDDSCAGTPSPVSPISPVSPSPVSPSSPGDFISDECGCPTEGDVCFCEFSEGFLCLCQTPKDCLTECGLFDPPELCTGCDEGLMCFCAGGGCSCETPCDTDMNCDMGEICAFNILYGQSVCVTPIECGTDVNECSQYDAFSGRCTCPNMGDICCCTDDCSCLDPDETEFFCDNF